METILLRSVWVRGALGPMTVWVTPGGFNELNYEDRNQWEKVYEKRHAPSHRSLVELAFDSPLLLRPGDMLGVYVHSARQGDSAVVYDNTRGSRYRHADDFIQIHSGLASLSSTPFGSDVYWGWGGAWRRNREFVGSISYAVQYRLFNPDTGVTGHESFPPDFKRMAAIMMMASLRPESPLARLPREVILYILNMCKWDWARDESGRVAGSPEPESRIASIARAGAGAAGTVAAAAGRVGGGAVRMSGIAWMLGGIRSRLRRGRSRTSSSNSSNVDSGTSGASGASGTVEFAEERYMHSDDDDGDEDGNDDEDWQDDGYGDVVYEEEYEREDEREDDDEGEAGAEDEEGGCAAGTPVTSSSSAIAAFVASRDDVLRSNGTTTGDGAAIAVAEMGSDDYILYAANGRAAAAPGDGKEDDGGCNAKK